MKQLQITVQIIEQSAENREQRLENRNEESKFLKSAFWCPFSVLCLHLLLAVKEQKEVIYV